MGKERSSIKSCEWRVYFLFSRWSVNFSVSYAHIPTLSSTICYKYCSIWFLEFVTKSGLLWCETNSEFSILSDYFVWMALHFLRSENRLYPVSFIFVQDSIGTMWSFIGCNEDLILFLLTM